MHRTCNVLYTLTKTYDFQSNYSIPWYLPLSKSYLQFYELISGNAHIFLLLGIGHQKWWEWATRSTSSSQTILFYNELPLFIPYSYFSEPTSGNIYIFLALDVRYRKWWWWTIMRFYSKMIDKFHKD